MRAAWPALMALAASVVWVGDVVIFALGVARVGPGSAG